MYLTGESVFIEHCHLDSVHTIPLSPPSSHHFWGQLFDTNFLIICHSKGRTRKNPAIFKVSLGEHVEGWAQRRLGTTKRKQDNNYSQYSHFPKMCFFKLSMNALPDARLATVSGTLFQISTTECWNDLWCRVQINRRKRAISFCVKR